MDEIRLSAPILADPQADLRNPLRGAYKWRGMETAPYPTPAVDAYDRFLWRDLQTGPGTYNWTMIDTFLAGCEGLGQKGGIRIQALVTGLGKVVPAFLTAGVTNTDGTFVPDWNDATFKATASAFFAALGARYNDDPRLGFVDIGFYGNWGEWHQYGLTGPTATLETMQAIVDWHIAAFPGRHRLVAMTDGEAVLDYAFSKDPLLWRPVGIRRDSAGHAAHFTKITAYANGLGARLAERWRLAPYITEVWAPIEPATFAQTLTTQHVAMLGNGNYEKDWAELSTAEQAAIRLAHAVIGYRIALVDLVILGPVIEGGDLVISSTWQNTGVTPTYEPTDCVLVWATPEGQVVAETVLPNVDFEALTPTPGAQFTDVLAVPPELTVGTYAVSVEIRDPTGYRQPLALHNQGGTIEGRYPVGAVTIGVPAPPDNSGRYLRHTASAGRTASTYTPTVPEVSARGDQLVVAVALPPDRRCATPTGWKLLAEDRGPSGVTAVYTRPATGAAPPAFRVSLDRGGGHAAVAVLYIVFAGAPPTLARPAGTALRARLHRQVWAADGGGEILYGTPPAARTVWHNVELGLSLADYTAATHVDPLPPPGVVDLWIDAPGAA